MSEGRGKGKIVILSYLSLFPSPFLSSLHSPSLPPSLPPSLLPVSYIVIHPIPYTPRIYRMRHSYANHWKKHKRPLDIGHRGLGDSFRPPEDLKPSATENTIASLKRAGAHVSRLSGWSQACQLWYNPFSPSSSSSSSSSCCSSPREQTMWSSMCS